MASIEKTIEREVGGWPGVEERVHRFGGIEVRGRVEVHSEGGKEIMENFADELIQIFPQRIVGWGMDSDAYERNSRSVG